MSAVITDISTPILPKDYSPPTVESSKITSPTQRRLVPAGPAFINYARLKLHHNFDLDTHDQHLATQQEKLDALNAANENGEDDLGVGDEEENQELLSLDPKEWKRHDYYAVLGLSHLRINATPAQIKVAHRKKVLKHHPDKKVSSGAQETSSIFTNLNTNDDAFFKCIQKAHEVLTHPEKRRQFDSVDPTVLDAEEDDPKEKDFTKSKRKLDDKSFFTTFSPIFERESRFSRKQPVPQLGNVDSSKEEVESFYDFWYSFDSWRSFEWLDKEVNEGSDSRDDKRYTEKKNKAERARRKKEDIARLRGLVDLALSLDPRIKRIKEEEKAARAAKKAGRSGTATPNKKAEEEAAKKAAEEEAKRKEEEEKAAREDAKKAKAKAANAAKKARRQARATEESTAA
ncbi:DnaJ domain-containing protein [Schizophyllum amplum]|uniref:DnaJ domain-containing protein n=1 Tax=Schizophyllum amplum TaxID=97359 RepID=A0A550CJE7_9AGAR|nr:DnaJ domain-containing protein [Auriculariopsis ampla]